MYLRNSACEKVSNARTVNKVYEITNTYTRRTSPTVSKQRNETDDALHMFTVIFTTYSVMILEWRILAGLEFSRYGGLLVRYVAMVSVVFDPSPDCESSVPHKLIFLKSTQQCHNTRAAQRS